MRCFKLGLDSFFAQPTEPALNVTLANLLSKRGLRALGEVKIHKGKVLKKPDVMMVLNAVKIILEGKFKGQRKVLESQCRKRIEDGLCDIAIAVEYKKTPFAGESLEKTLEKMKFEANVYWVTGNTGWQENIDVNELVKMIRGAYTRAASNDIVGEAVKDLNEALDRWFNTISLLGGASVKTMAEKTKKILEVREKAGK